MLEWTGRHARALLAAGVFVGILLPDLASLLRPLLAPAVVGTLTAALLRLDWERLRQALRQPRLALWLSLWQLVLSPLLAGTIVLLLGLPAGLALSLILQAAAPPIGSAAVFVLMLGRDATLSLVVAVATALALPLTLTALVAALPAFVASASVVRIDLAEFFLRVTLFVAAPFLLAGVLRRLFGVSRLARNDDLLGAINVLLLVIFAVAVMDGVTGRLLAEPGTVVQVLLSACVAALLLHAAGYLAFIGQGATAALTAAVCSGNRNMGLMLAITAGSAGAEFSLYVGLAQIPMYFAPLLLAPLLRRTRL